MTMLWLSIGTLLLIALWFLSLPLRRARAIHDWQQRFEADDAVQDGAEPLQWQVCEAVFSKLPGRGGQ